jgi:hypothetical protein
MTANWPTNVQLITDGEPVDAAVSGRPDSALVARTDYLKARLDQALLGQCNVAYASPSASNCLLGQPVYWNSTDAQFEQALAGVVTTPTGTLAPSPSSFVLGVVANKESANVIDVLLGGFFKLDLTNALLGPLAAGQYYLSSAQAGILIQQPVSLSIPVLFADGFGGVYVRPEVRNPMTDHVHYTFPLVCLPAGNTTPPPPGGRHSITASNPNLPGWLPASHSVFGGHAPLGAAFGYNMAQDPNKIQTVWPPIPIGAVSIEWNKAQNHVGGTIIPVNPSHGLVYMDVNGIWWMSDCYGDVPWPVNLHVPPGPSSSASISAGGPHCPRPEVMELKLSFARLAFATH